MATSSPFKLLLLQKNHHLIIIHSIWNYADPKPMQIGHGWPCDFVGPRVGPRKIAMLAGRIFFNNNQPSGSDNCLEDVLTYVDF
jgi:hypothetical protein